MDTPSEYGGSDRRARLLKRGAFVALLPIVLVASIWLLAPQLTEYLLLRQLENLQQRTGLDIEAESIRTSGLEGVEIRRLVISAPGDEDPIAIIDEIDASADLWRAARGHVAVTAVDMRGVEIFVHRRADGTTNLEDLIADDGAADDVEDAAHDAFYDSLEDVLDDAVERVLVHFADAYPDLVVEDLTAHFTHDSGADPWPVDRVTMDRFVLEGDRDAAAFATKLHIKGPENEAFRLPERISIEGTARRPAARSTIAIDVDPEIRLTNLPGLPYVELGLSAIAIPEPYALEIHAPSLDTHLRQTPYQLAAAERVRIDVNRWALSPSQMSITDLMVESPRLYIEYNEAGASNLQELHTILRQPTALAVAHRADEIAEAMATVDDDIDDDAEVEIPQPAPGLFFQTVDAIANLPVEKWLSEVLPRTTTITDLRLTVDDARPHDDLVNPAPQLEVTGDILELRHSPLQGKVDGDFQFRTRAGDDLATADIKFTIPYRSGDWNARVEIEDFELAHLSQIAGPRVSAHLQGGLISAKLDIRNASDADGTTRFDGVVSGQTVRLFHGGIAADPIEVDDGSLELRGFYNPDMEIPAPELIDLSDDETHDGDEDSVKPPEYGGFVVEEATARLGELEGTMGFALYGLEDSHRPTRIDIDVDLPSTELQTIVDSIPTALLGPFDGITFAGTLRWLFSLEIPLYEASQMRWNAEVDLSPNFDVVDIPSEIDVFKLYDSFEHTIEEEWTGRFRYRERKFSYERTITIPEARPTPVEWFLDNTTFELETIDRIWRRRNWPPVPYDQGMDPQILNSPQFWHTAVARRNIADVPWPQPSTQSPSSANPLWGWDTSSDEASNEPEFVYESSPEDPFNYRFIPQGSDPIPIDPDRYGPYVYVPLHHISPYLVRAIMTTEDTGFFTHSGFNYLAIRQSVETNLEAGRFVRGASTISMQLARNLFLDRSRVMSRKLQEVALVWLMESVADIPKERMMELYLNIIEFGPGIYGIHEASIHYFGKRPDELTIGESAWLVSIVPSPKRYHSHYDRGEISPVWQNRMRRYIRAMKARDRISESEMERALEEEVTFYTPEQGDPLLRAELPADETIDPDDIDPDDSVDVAEEPAGIPLFE